ncbi:MAG: GIY-YIG nuclease family protein [Pseudohongiella sp.]|uniref:GIY-YIG nuclease family protein n=1 Tax=Pseudohongiella sp. TaxID=1979412 RepID=UPI0034A077C4
MTEAAQPDAAPWSVYLVRCADDSLYTGIATDVLRRFTEHQAQGPKTARYLRGRAPLTLVFQCPAGDRSQALKLEYRIKQLSRADKLRLVAGDPQLLLSCAR